MARTGFWKALFRPGPLSGATLDYSRAWEVSAPPWPIRLAPALGVLLSEQGVVALEGSSIHAEVKETLQPHVIISDFEISPGTLYPPSEWLHIRSTVDALRTLNELVSTCAGPEIWNHLYAYESDTLLLAWHDTFADPIHIASTVSSAVIAAFCSELGVSPAKPPSEAIS